MADNQFPILTTGIDDWDSFQEDYLVDPTIRTKNQEGRQLARPGVESLQKVWRYRRVRVTTADKKKMDDFQIDVNIGGEPFWWKDPRPNGISWYVRFGAPVEFRPTSHAVGYYNLTYFLIEETES